jgi:diacylglycerol kinase (ATP)
LKKIALIYNVFSGRKFNKREFDKYRNLLLLDGNIDEFKIKNPDELTTQVENLSRNYDLIVIAGGDGSANGVINLLYPTTTPFLILPFGSGNDISAICHHDKGIKSIAKALLKFETSNLDLIEIEGHKKTYCATVTCVGTDAQVSARASHMPRYLAGSRYILATLIEIFLNSKVFVDVCSKELRYQGFVSICSIANSPRYGAGIKISPKSDPFDGRLELIFVERLNRLRLIGLFLLLLLGLHTLSSQIKISQVEEIEITSENFDHDIWGDGQKLGELPVKISRAKSPLKVVVVDD